MRWYSPFSPLFALYPSLTLSLLKLIGSSSKLKEYVVVIITHTVDLLVDAITMEKERGRAAGGHNHEVNPTIITSASIRQLDGVLGIAPSVAY